MKDGSRLGLWIAIAALCVNAPRLVQAFLEADGLQLSDSLRPLLMGATGVAAALTLTGGGAWLAHELARGAGSEQRGQGLQGLLLTCWLLVLGGQLVLIPPLLMVEMATSRLGAVLATGWQRWLWAFVAVLLVEVVAAGAMAAQGRRSRWGEARERDAERLESLALERAKLERKLAAQESELAALRQRMAGADGANGANGANAAAKRPRQRRPRKRSGSARSSGSESAAREVPCRNGCGWVGRSQNAENAHQGGCALAARRPLASSEHSQPPEGGELR